ncbi:MAG: hypothetical protein MJE77_17060 [Proteobacteria bacterium]|nr:hypothetical protein [Pseudomonadota bacterium]
MVSRRLPEPSVLSLEREYAARAKSLSALAEILKNGFTDELIQRLESVAQEVGSVVARLGSAATRSHYAVFQELLGIVAFVGKWVLAVRRAEPDADRFLRAGRIRTKDLVDAGLTTVWANPVDQVLTALGSAGDLESVDRVIQPILGTPLPLPIVGLPLPQKTMLKSAPPNGARGETKTPTPVGIVEFSLAGQPIANRHHVAPNITHDLSIALRLSGWPMHATRLVVEPLTVVQPGDYDLPRFEFGRPEGMPPHRLEQTKAMLLKTPQAFWTAPLEFSFTGWFKFPDGEKSLKLEGQKRIELRSYDAALHPVTGWEQVDNRLLSVMDELRSYSGLGSRQVAAFMLLLARLGAAAAQSLQDALFNSCTNEASFQEKLRDYLRLEPRIGSHLDEHPRAGGGITDLSLDGVRLELKYDSQPVTPTDVENFLQQTVQYVVGSDSRLGLLCVLDNSSKDQAPGSVVNDIVLKRVPPPNQPNGALVLIGVIIIRGNLARPSDLSR